MKKIVIVGYPKSGNTWLTRLVAELLNCPIKGFWSSDREEMAKEGLSRVSEYVCYKSHHQLKELKAKREKPDKIIYVIRDPRDITISGKNYFKSIKIIDPKKTHLTFMAKVVDKVFYGTIGKYFMKKRMMRAVLYGDETVSRWCKVSWKNHVIPFLEFDDSQKVCTVTYEEMLSNPIEGCQKILQFLEIDRSIDQIEVAVEKQSFAMAKKKFKNEKAFNKANFLRKGGSGYWVESFSEKEKQLFVNKVGPELQRLGYPL